MVPKAGHLQAITNRDALEHAFAFADQTLKTKSDSPPAQAAAATTDIKNGK